MVKRYNTIFKSRGEVSCSLCNGMRRHGPPDNKSKDRRHFVPRFTWEELLASSNSCYCCDILLRGCRGCLDQHGPKEAEIDNASLRFRYLARLETIEEQETGKIIVIRFQNGKKFLIEVFAVDEPGGRTPKSWGDFSRPGIEHYLDYADSLCNLGERLPPLPTRVMDVGLEDDVVKVFETAGAEGIYVCLSHCWGDTQILATTRATLAERKRSIPWDSLCQTFKDDIIGARTLGIKYGLGDGVIYRNGFFTIAATYSPNGDGGLFRATPDFRVSGRSREGERYTLHFREMIEHHIESLNECDDESGNPTTVFFPLLTRAWVYQERMLSTRVIHFGRYELFFECHSGIRCECEQIESLGAAGSWRGLFKIELATALLYYDLAHKGEYRPGLQYHGAALWRTVVSAYTALRLTKPSDRLPAIGDMAREMAARNTK
ncbi:hypothetical protein BO82DRAFT_405655 [Aspergillus uvarum CBS 121591]|uniref:Uncharacterized protein n=1 Tax=Aspergillus uvarum CBS 121591 TaxID=1448315 RepID=A0A319C182_9EURO|nr:hypothetical protein BO82DRAFT_405655 [Aspergillus uvarum CBS 121591]PYH77957.1 hypothetical protein BO82DRAFT_405655 [Aspergillus uvarum CBS 121591]